MFCAESSVVVFLSLLCFRLVILLFYMFTVYLYQCAACCAYSINNNNNNTYRDAYRHTHRHTDTHTDSQLSATDDTCS